MIKVQDILDKCKPNYWIKVKSKRIPNIEWYITSCVFDEVKRNRIILKAQPTIKSPRTNPTTNILLNLQFFNKDWSVYVYFKDKVVTLPVQSVSIDTKSRIVYLFVE